MQAISSSISSGIENIKIHRKELNSVNKNCSTCRFAYHGDLNDPMVVAHKWNTDIFTFTETSEEIIANPVYDLTCENEHNWKPSRGDMLVDSEYHCEFWEKEDTN
jgi:hypothetical protein